MSDEGYITNAVKLHFAAGHRIIGLPDQGAKCRNIHGHTWTVTWTFEATTAFPPVVEFGQVKSRLDQFVKTVLDHGFFVDAQDDFLNYLKVNNLKHVVVPGPPTTELLAQWIAAETIERLAIPPGQSWRVGDEGYDEELRRRQAMADALLSVHIEEGPQNSATWWRRSPSTYKVVTVSPGGSGGGGGGGGGNVSRSAHASGGAAGGGGQ